VLELQGDWKATLTVQLGITPGAFPDLEVLEEIGRGAETVVYRVRRRDAEYALKLLTRTSGDAERSLNAVRREAALLACVGHPLLPRIFEVGQVDGTPYLVLEYIDGRPLSEILRAGPLDETSALRLAIDVVGPLAAAHRAGLVHRDVKPDNVIVGPNGTARLIDFGLAVRGGAYDDRVAGTLLYSAPEQTGMLKRPVDGRSDLYALGVMLFESVTGHRPYHSPDAGELIALHATAPVPDPRAIRPELSPTLAAIIGRLIAKDPDDRYQSGDNLLTDLERLCAQPGTVFDVGRHLRDSQPTDPGVLIGRETEVKLLGTRWATARDGRGGAALVQGPAGVGKSRLVAELSTTPPANGGLVLYGKCVADDPVPLAPLRTAVERYLQTLDRLPPAQRDLAVAKLRRAAGPGGSLLRALSPMLAELVQAPDLGEKDRHEQFINAVAAFLINLATDFGGAVLHLDDVQWLDGATRRVLQQMAARLPDAPLLLVATGRDDADNLPALARFAADLGRALDTRIALAPLNPDAVADLVTLHLGGVRLSRKITDELVARVGGNPFTVVEYVRTITDAGLITPRWGSWRLDLAALNRLELSGDVLDLVLQRIDGLGPQTRRLLAAGAATGRRFQPDLVAAACDIDLQRSRNALAEAQARRLVTRSGSGWYAFPHDRIREALLADLKPAALRRLHQRIAEVLEAAAPTDPRHVYATARHYMLGDADRTPDKVSATSLAAGRLALTEHAPEEALGFLQTAADAARKAGRAPDADLHFALGVSCSRTGRFTEALEHLDKALRGKPDRLWRANVLAQIASVHLSAWNPGRAFDTACRGLAELGRPLPRGRLRLLLTTLASFLVGLAVGVTRIGFGGARDANRDRHRLEAVFYDAAAHASTMTMRLRMRPIMSLRALYPINRVGPSSEYIRHMAGFGLVAELAGLRLVARRIFDRATALAAELGDPVTGAHVEWRRGAARFISGADDSQAWMRALIDHERWLELGDCLTAVGGISVQLFQVGRTREAQAWYQRGQARLGAGALAEGAGIGAIAAILPAQFGRPQEATAAIDALRRFLALNPDNRTQLINLLAAQIVVLVEQGELGAPFEQIVAEFEQLQLGPSQMLPAQRIYYTYQAFGRLAQCHQAPGEQQATRHTAATRAVAQLGRGAKTCTMRAYHRIARADLAVLAGRPQTAMRELTRAEREIVHLDAPLIAYEAARVRARALQAADQPTQALQQAQQALTIAIEHQWSHRIHWVCREFALAAPNTVQGIVSNSDRTRHQRRHQCGHDPGGRDALSRSRLAALHQVSLAAARVLDPAALARLALDETLRNLGGERAYLFLVDPETGRLLPHLGRDRDGTDIDELTAYSSTLVDRVRDTGKALVVTGSEEGVALGSRSAHFHGLRSIMIAPLQAGRRLFGVVYLDTRVAKGMFANEDVEILTAIMDPVAVSLQASDSTRTTEDPPTVQTQPHPSGPPGTTVTTDSASPTPASVTSGFLQGLAHTLAADASVLLSRDDHALVVVASHGAAASAGTRLDPIPSTLLDLTGPRAGTISPGTSPPFGGLLGSPRSWWATPIAEHGNPPRILVVGFNHHEAIHLRHVDLAAALDGEDLAPYDTTRLLDIRPESTIDGLTGLLDRNQFLAKASEQLKIARTYRRAIAAIALDTNHLKRINDSYGHAVADEVIRAVATRLKQAAPDGNVLGRVGAEEFALLAPETGTDPAALAERLHEVVCGQPVSTEVGPVPVTITIGMVYTDSGQQDLDGLLAQAGATLHNVRRPRRA